MEENGFVQITRKKSIAENEFYPMIYAMYEQIWQNVLPTEILTKDLTAKRAKNLITPPDTPIPDCVTCGVCCEVMLCVGVRPSEDISGDHYWNVTIEGENGEITVDRFLRRDAETFACQLLEIREDEKKVCRIYENRPQMCRDFDAGSDKCHALRRAFGFEPFLSFAERREAVEKIDEQIFKMKSSETIREVKFIETETGELQISAFLNDDSVKTIHTFNPETEKWRQFEFDALTLKQAAELIENRRSVNKIS